MPTPDETRRAAARRLAILDELVERKRHGLPPPTIRELAAQGEVSTMTTRTDLAVLVRLGIVSRLGGARGIVVHEDRIAELHESAGAVEATP